MLRRQLTVVQTQGAADNRELAQLRPLLQQSEALARRAENLEALLKGEMEKVRCVWVESRCLD